MDMENVYVDNKKIKEALGVNTNVIDLHIESYSDFCSIEGNIYQSKYEGYNIFIIDNLGNDEIKYKICGIYKDDTKEVCAISRDWKLLIQKQEGVGIDDPVIDQAIDNYKIDVNVLSSKKIKGINDDSLLYQIFYLDFITKNHEYIDKPYPIDTFNTLIEIGHPYNESVDNYDVRHTGLWYKGDDVYAFFKKNILTGIATENEKLIGKSPTLNNQKLPRLFDPFPEKHHLVLNAELFGNYNKKILSNHSKFDHGDRKKDLLKSLNFSEDDYVIDNNKDKKIIFKKKEDEYEYENKLIELIKSSSKKSINDRRRAYPCIWYDKCSHELNRTFMLPIGYNLVAVVRKVRKNDADTTTNSKKRPMSSTRGTQNNDKSKEESYKIATFLTVDMAITQLRYFHQIGNDWVTLGEVKKKIDFIDDAKFNKKEVKKAIDCII